VPDETENGRVERAEHKLLGRFSYLDAAVFLVPECIALPLNIAAGDAVVHRDVIAVLIGWGAAAIMDERALRGRSRVRPP
jgi:hypothetical protein